MVRHVAYMNQACHIHEWSMSHIWMEEEEEEGEEEEEEEGKRGWEE